MIDEVKIYKKVLFFQLLLQLLGFGWLMITSKMDFNDLISYTLTLSLNIIALFLNNIDKMYLIEGIILILVFVYLVLMCKGLV